MMFDSAKFLLPSVTDGLPAPGPLEELAGALLEPELLVVLELLPHATSTAPASIVTSTVTARVRTPLNLVDLLPSIRRLLLVVHHVNDNPFGQIYAAAAEVACAIVPAPRLSALALRARGVRACCSSVSAPSTASASSATQIAAPSTPEKW